MPGTAFWTYFSNLVGIVQLHLPGVFEKNPAVSIVKDLFGPCRMNWNAAT